jgi:hypothetical protein
MIVYWLAGFWIRDVEMSLDQGFQSMAVVYVTRKHPENRDPFLPLRSLKFRGEDQTARDDRVSQFATWRSVSPLSSSVCTLSPQPRSSDF